MECETEGGMVIRGGWEREEAVEGRVLEEVVMCVVGGGGGGGGDRAGGGMRAGKGSGSG